MHKHLMAAITALTLAFPAAAQPAKADDQKAPVSGKILIVVTNHGRTSDSPENAKPTGYWLSEVSHAWSEFVDANYEVDFASPRGGIAPVDPRSFEMDDPDNKRMWGIRRVVEQLAETTPLAEVKPAQYAAVYFAGGHGTMWDFPDSQVLQDVTQKFWEQGKVVSAVCHGPAALVNVKTDEGEALVKGRKVAAFTNSEEKATGLDDDVPFLLETKLEEQGATVETAPNYQEKVVVDGRLITGQNPASAEGVAKAVVKTLKGKRGRGSGRKATNATAAGKNRKGGGKKGKRAARRAARDNEGNAE